MKTFGQSSFKKGQGSTNKLNRREMMSAGLALGLTGVVLPGQTLSPVLGELHAGESGKEPTTDVRNNGLASIKGPSALLNKKLEETSISGPTRACGKAYGSIFADLMHGYMTRETKPSHSRLGFAKACLPFIEKYTPFSFDFLQGTAEGSGFTLEQLTLLSLYEEIWKGSGLAAQQHTYEGHCTAFISSRTRSEDERTIVGQSWDFWPHDFPWVCLLRLQCDGHPATLTFNFPGMWSGCGINSEGLAQMWTSAGFLPVLANAPGVPTYILISELLSRKSVPEAVDFLQKTPNAGAYIFLLADAKGKTAVVEALPGGKLAVDYSPVNCRTNQYETPELVEASYQDLSDPDAKSTKKRNKEAHKVLQSCNESLSLDIVKSALTTKPIFREELFDCITIASLIACCEEQALWYCRGGLEPGQWTKTVL
ncbi:C45 family autoproteolytic acyltransferase/hydrolase [Planctomycetota bacterium]